MSHKRITRFASLFALVLAMQMLLAACDLNPSNSTPAPSATATNSTAATPTTVAMNQATPTTVAMNQSTPTTAMAGATATTAMAADTPTAAMSGETPTAATADTTATVDNNAPTVNRPLLSFADFKVPDTSVKASVAPYTVKTDLSDVQNPAEFALDDAAKAAIAKNLFVVMPLSADKAQQYGKLNEFFQVYEAGRYGQEPIFVSSDSVLHVYHQVFDKMLRDLESQKLAGEARILSDAMVRLSDEQHSEVLKLNNADLTAASEQLVAYFAVADKLLASTYATPAYVQDRVNKEVAQIEAHSGLANSNIFTNYKEDYGQYNPRGHYTKSDALKQYFKAMVWYGRMTFRQQSASETLSAILLTQALGSGQTLKSGPVLDHWKAIYEPTVFIVGKADDLSYFDYAPAIQAVYGSATPSLQDLTDKSKLDTFRAAIDKMPSPLINSMFVYLNENKEQVTKGLRMMGQRFTLDAYVIGQLTWRNVGTSAGSSDTARWLPRALDIPAAMGSDRALSIITQGTQEKFGQGQGAAAKNYDTQMQKVRQDITKLQTSDWTQNLYWSWLYTLNALVTPKAEGYPSFMLNDAWNDKQLNAYLGSYTELKHDTILYAKQSMAEMGGGPEELPKGYVEPQPELYARLSALTHMTTDGLKSRNLLPTTTEQLLGQAQTLIDRCLAISLKELRNEPLTQEEYDFIAFYGTDLEGITTNTADMDCDPSVPAEECQGRAASTDQFDAALAADIASSPDGTALQEATGHPMEIYVVVPIEGKKILARGAVYSHYEFVVDSGNRLTDEAWQQQLAAGKAPAMADWTKSFIVSK